jgi:hypothetical protein
MAERPSFNTLQYCGYSGEPMRFFVFDLPVLQRHVMEHLRALAFPLS